MNVFKNRNTNLFTIQTEIHKILYIYIMYNGEILRRYEFFHFVK